MIQKRSHNVTKPNSGFSLIELVAVVAVASILTAVAIPNMISQRRLIRSVGVTREVSAQLRYTRQLAMSQRRAFTFNYDDSVKVIKIIGPIPVGALALVPATGYPNNAGSRVISTVALTEGGLSASEIIYGIPSAADLPSGAPVIPTGALYDGISKTPLTSNKLNITFQPDGSVIDSTGSLVNRAMFLFNKKAAQATASAISVMGSSGRVKVWRYTSNGNKYAE